MIAAAPSVEFHLQRLWDFNPQTFWATVIELHTQGVAPLAVVHAADVAARSFSDIGQLAAPPIRSSTARRPPRTSPCSATSHSHSCSIIELTPQSSPNRGTARAGA